MEYSGRGWSIPGEVSIYGSAVLETIWTVRERLLCSDGASRALNSNGGIRAGFCCVGCSPVL